jgi:hypothetical protein
MRPLDLERYVARTAWSQRAELTADWRLVPLIAPRQCRLIVLAARVTVWPAIVKLAGNSCATVSGCESDLREAMCP